MKLIGGNLSFFFLLIFILILLTSYITKKHKFILNKHKSQLKFLYKNAILCIFIRTLPPTQNDLIERKTIACVWELRHFSIFFRKQFVQKPSIFHRTFSVCLCFFEQYLFQCYRFLLFSFLMIEGLIFYSFYPSKCTT